ncbi:MAG: creatininase family protein [Phenylobacterium sp.]|nr:creatininase family protein [Phenylobacterium sp.]
MKLRTPLLAAAAAALLGLAPSLAAAQAPPAGRIVLPAKSPVWQPHKTKNYLPEMTWPEVKDLLTRTDMVIIPVGAIEQHGPQGPLGTDVLNGLERAKLVAQYTDVLVAPILMVGNSPYHVAFPGSISLSAETVQKVYVEAVESLIKQGFKRFLILNSHGGNQATSQFIVDRINQETAGIAVELGGAIRPFMPSQPDTKKPRPFDRHGGVNETSASLYLIPDLVDMKAAKQAKLSMPPHLTAMVPAIEAGDPTTTLVFLAEALKTEETGKKTASAEMTDNGVWSSLDPRNATAERGRQGAEAFVNATVQFIQKWNQLRPMGTKP